MDMDLELCGYEEEKHTLGAILDVDEMEISKSGVQDTLLNVDLTVQSPIQKHMDTARNLVEENTEPKKTRRRRKSRNRKPNLSENVELCGYGEEKLTVGGILDVEEMEISKSVVQDTLLNVDLTLQSPIQKHMDIAGNLVEENAEPKKTRRRRKSKNMKPNLDENMELCGYGEVKHTVGGILEVEEMEISKSVVQDTILNVDLTVQSPIQKHMNTAGNLVEENTEPKKTRRRRKSKNRKPNLGENMELCGYGEEKQTVGGILEVEEMEISKSGLQDTLLNVDLTVQSPTQKHKDTARNLVEENTVPKKTCRRRKSKSRKPNLGENMELCGYGEEKHTVGGILEVVEMEISKRGVQDTLLNVDLTVQSPIQKHMDTARCLVEESTEKKKNRRKRRPKAQLKDNLQILDQTEVVSALSLSDNPQVVGGDDTLNNVQVTNQEFQFSSREKARHSVNNEERFRNDPVAVVGKVNSLLKILHPAPERTPVSRLRRKLLILDINGLLADVVFPAPKECKADVNISKRAIFKRPFCGDFLRFCFERFDVGIWSSRTKKLLDRVIDYLLGDVKHKLLLIWDKSHCTGTQFKTLENRHKCIVFKELKKIWEISNPSLPWKKGDYNESNTMLLDDSPYKALLNPVHTGIFPFSYSFKDGGDNSLGPGGDLRVYLEGLASADNWKEYIEKHPFGQRGIDESSPHWDFYSKVLGSRPNLWRKSNMKMNTDGSVKEGHEAGIGGVLRNDRGEWVKGFYGKIHKCPSLQAELQAIYTGLAMISQMGLSMVEFETDSLIAVNMLNGPDDDFHPLMGLVNDCKKLLEMSGSRIKFREANKVADCLAKKGASENVRLKLLEEPIIECKSLLMADVMSFFNS